MNKNLSNIFPVKSAITLWILTSLCFLPLAAGQTLELDSLRVLIRSLQNDMEKKETLLSGLSEEFNSVNERIYKYKTEQNAGVNPFLNLRMQNALKTSHQFADSLDSINQQLRDSKSKLQQAFSEAIKLIEAKIQEHLTIAKQESQNRNLQKKQLNLIKKLENEKTDYTASLQTMEIDEKGWERIAIEAGDNLRRLKLKAALLEDFLNNLNQSIRTLESEREKNRGDRKTYTQLLDFYKELDESLDDDQDIFDRNRLEELRDKISNLDTEYARLKRQMSVLSRDVSVLKAKIELFYSAITEKETLKGRWDKISLPFYFVKLWFLNNEKEKNVQGCYPIS